MIMTALVVSSSTAGSFGFSDSAPQAVGPDDFEADQSRERSADRSRPSRERAARVDSSPRDTPSTRTTPAPRKSAPPTPNRAAATASSNGAPGTHPADQ
jgi:hypothetical protein